MRKRHCGQTELGPDSDGVANECTSRRTRALKLEGGIEGGFNAEKLKLVVAERRDFFGGRGALRLAARQQVQIYDSNSNILVVPSRGSSSIDLCLIYVLEWLLAVDQHSHRIRRTRD